MENVERKNAQTYSVISCEDFGYFTSELIRGLAEAVEDHEPVKFAIKYDPNLEAFWVVAEAE